MNIQQVLERLRENDPELTRLEIVASLFQDASVGQIQEFLTCLPYSTALQTVHVSGSKLDQYLSNDQLEQLLLGVGELRNLQDLSLFRGGQAGWTEDLVARCLGRNQGLRVLMMWNFASYADSPSLAAVLRQHEHLQRITLTLPPAMPWACLDVYAMGLACMPLLQVLQIRCEQVTVRKSNHHQSSSSSSTLPPSSSSSLSTYRVRRLQSEAVLSPEAMAVLIASRSITSLYLENCGLQDDHVDAICEELVQASQKASAPPLPLRHLDLKDNQFTDDILYTWGRALPFLTSLRTLDVSGVPVTQAGGQALAEGMARNTTLTYLELEGVLERYQDEFFIPPSPFEGQPWMDLIYYHIRLNRAVADLPLPIHRSKRSYVQALNMVSDQVGCLYHLIRSYPHYFERS